MTARQCHNLMTRIDRVTTHDSLHAACREIADAFHCHYFVLIAVMPTSLYNPDTYIVNGYPAQWWRHYHGAGHCQHDPIALRAMQGATCPIIWHNMDFSQDPDPVSAQQVMRDAAQHGMQAGVSFPRIQSGLYTTFSLASNQAPPLGHSLIHHILPQARLISTNLCAAVERIVAANGRMGRFDHALTERERSSLFWSASGCTSAEIAAKTGVSAATVTDHLRNATRKLGATNRAQAVARALMFGTIRPGNAECQGAGSERAGHSGESGTR